MRYYVELAAAYIRGHAVRTGVPVLPDELREKPLSGLTPEERSAVLEAGKAAQLKLYPFKTTHGDLPRVKKVMGFLKGIPFETLLDAGSGRGVFLFPFLAEFPWVQVTAVDLLPYRAEFLQEMTAGGLSRLKAVHADLCAQPFPEKSADVVTLLEVLEHIPDVESAVKAAVKTARRFVVVTVPSKEDSNPEHIHLLTKERLTELFAAAGCGRLHFSGVNGHLMMTATLT